MTRYLARALAGGMPSVAEWNEHVVAFHDTYGDGTPGFVSRFRTADGLTSYELLAARIRLGARHDSRVLDVGCGSGELLRVLAASIPHAVLEGIDLSERQLALARDAVPGARLVQGDAASLAFAERGYDAIAAHLSIMSMPHTEAILHALHRGLKPNGLLVLATEDPLSGDSIVRGIAASLTHLAGRFPGSAFAIPERASIERDDVLRNALAAAGFSNVSLERVTLRAGIPVDDLWSAVEQTYPLGLLDYELRAWLRGKFIADDGVKNSGEATLALRFVFAYA